MTRGKCEYGGLRGFFGNLSKFCNDFVLYDEKIGSRRVVMYYARGMRDLLQTTQLNMEFFEDLNSFQIHFIEMCFRQSLDYKMGIMTDVEEYNLHLFEEFKLRQIEDLYGVDPEYLKRAA